MGSVASVLPPGAVLHVLCFSDAEPPGYGPRRVSEAELRRAFAGRFELEALRATRFANHLSDAGARAWIARLRRLPSDDADE